MPGRIRIRRLDSESAVKLRKAGQIPKSFPDAEEAAQIIVDAHKKIEAEEEKAVSQLKKDIGKLAVLTAEQIMQKELGDEDRQELVDKVIEEAGSGKWQSQ